MISLIVGLILLTIAITLIQLGAIAAALLIGIVAIILSGAIALVIYLITAGRGIFNERKTESHF